MIVASEYIIQGENIQKRTKISDKFMIFTILVLIFMNIYSMYQSTEMDKRNWNMFLNYLDISSYAENYDSAVNDKNLEKEIFYLASISRNMNICSRIYILNNYENDKDRQKHLLAYISVIQENIFDMQENYFNGTMDDEIKRKYSNDLFQFIGAIEGRDMKNINYVENFDETMRSLSNDHVYNDNIFVLKYYELIDN